MQSSILKYLHNSEFNFAELFLINTYGRIISHQSIIHREYWESAEQRKTKGWDPAFWLSRIIYGSFCFVLLVFNLKKWIPTNIADLFCGVVLFFLFKQVVLIKRSNFLTSIWNESDSCCHLKSEPRAWTVDTTHKNWENYQGHSLKVKPSFLKAGWPHNSQKAGSSPRPSAVAPPTPVSIPLAESIFLPIVLFRISCFWPMTKLQARFIDNFSLYHLLTRHSSSPP